MVLSASPTVEAPMRIGGRDVTAEEWITVLNPAAIDEEVGRVPRGDASHVRAAADAARDAFRTWSKVPPAERAAILRRAGEILSADLDRRATLATREVGSLFSEGRGGLAGNTRALDYYAKVGESYPYEQELPSPNGRVVVIREPMGVAGLVVPWNSPNYLAFLSLAPILMAGNSVVVKPPTDAPLALMESLRLIEPLFPVGTINVVTGPGPVVGKAIATDPVIRKINFTGSSVAGKEVLVQAAATVKRCSMELGGNDPAIVFADVDLDDAVPELIQGVFYMAGQICYDVKRIYVERPRYREFVDRFTAAADAKVVGNGLDPRATMGPLVNRTQFRWVSGLIEEARRSGATVDVVGSRLDPDTWDRGYYVLPVVVTDTTQESSIVRCEQFGPVIPILPFDTEDEAVELANDSEYGLTSSVWSDDLVKAERVARRIEAGTTFINVHKRGASGVDMPKGGYKDSGLGVGHGVPAFEEQLEVHTVSSRRPA